MKIAKAPKPEMVRKTIEKKFTYLCQSEISFAWTVRLGFKDYLKYAAVLNLVLTF